MSSSIVLFRLHTQSARDWWDRYVADGPRLGQDPAVEWRYADAIREALEADGYEAGVDFGCEY